MKTCAWAAIAAIMLSAAMAAAADEASSRPAAADYAAVAKAVAPSLARVEITLQYDKGEAPGDASLVMEERPLETAGFVLSPTKIVYRDTLIHPRFIKGIAVRFGQQVVEARVSAYANEGYAVFLDLAQPLKDAKPLKFAGPAKGPLLAATYYEMDGEWKVFVSTWNTNYVLPESGPGYQTIEPPVMAVTRQGEPVGLCMTDRISTDDAWQVSPDKWATTSAAEMAKLLKSLEERCDQCVLRVGLSFRSPKKASGSPYGMRGGYDEEDFETGTERNVLGILTDDKTVVVLTNLKRTATARLERIKVYPAKGESVEAKFNGTLSDYGCFLARLDKPLSGAAAVFGESLVPLRGKLLMAADVMLQGEKKVCYYDHNRITDFRLGWKRKLYPSAPSMAGRQILFSADGKLLALPVAHRPKAGMEGEYRSSSYPILTPVALLTAAMADLANNIDKTNVPLTEEEENRIAWTGMVLQPLDRELARINNVSQQTQDGATGAIVSYVYPGSPADKAGIKQGAILLRLHFKDQPKPLEVRVEGDRYADSPVPWNLWDRMPEAAFDRIPTPWPAAEDSLCRTLTEMGFGKQYTAEFFSGGQIVNKDFAIEQGPPHYDSAPRYKWDAAGLTVRDLTYELRRYFQKKDDDPGVIISKVEAGRKAAVAGIKPYEMITHIDGSPVANVKDFQKLLKKEGEIKLSVSNPFKGRQTKINLTGGPTTSNGPASRPRAPLIADD
ncbi:MAG: PDZ domain-containing protein [Phycisphaerae bacterium]